MEAIDGQKKEIEENKDNINNLAANNIEQIHNDIDKLSNNKSNSNRKQSTDSNQDSIKKTFLKEFGIKEKKVITFDYEHLKSIKSCTSYYLGDENYTQEAYICTICNIPKDKYICKYCHEFCHKKCRNTLKEIPKSLEKKENKEIKSFSCYCGSNLKHTFDIKVKKDIVSCNMMELDSILGISPNYCSNHKIVICWICSAVCHKECVKIKQNNISNDLSCQCKSDFHSNFNEFALSFPLEEYKKNADIDVWPVQILNILFNRGKTFNKMSKFFLKFISTNIDFNSPKNNAIVNQFKSLLELFSNTFNRKFKTYYYDQQMINSFEYEKLFSLIKHLKVTNGQTTIIKFRLHFILLFIHLRKDFRIIKSLTSNDFMCNNILQRLTYKKLLKSKMQLNEKIDEKYKIREDFPLKKFALHEVCVLMTKGMLYISVEENQDEFEIGLKLICFMLKHLMFSKEDLITLIDSLAIFYDNFYEYVTKEKNNIYSLLDICNAIVEICYMITINYNDLVIEEYLENPNKEIGKFIHVKSEHSVKLLSIVFKNCDLFTKHFKILIKPNLDDKTDEEQKRENNLRKHKIAMQQKILNQTTGVSTKMPANGGLFTDKICNLNNETICMFCLADNSYQKQLGYIKEEEFQDYFIFSKQLESQDYQANIMQEKGENILCELKLGLEKGYYSLFTSSYNKEENLLKEKLKIEILSACDKIKIRLDAKSQDQYYINLINEEQMNNANKRLTDIELIRRNILNEISRSINFAKNPILLTQKGRDNLVNDLIKVQVDESIFKGFFFLTNIHFPNIINHELVKIFLDFLSLYFLTKRGIMYLLTGKNIQVIQRLINRFRFDDKNKNLNQLKNRTEEFNVNSIKDVIHFLCMLSKFVRILEIKTLKKHKSLFKFKKSILSHFKNYVHHINTEEQLIEYKLQLKEGLEIFNNLYESYNYNQNEEIKNEILDIFKNNPYDFLNPKLFQRWFDRSQINLNDNNFVNQRNNELDYYFQFFEIMTKNSFFVYKNDDEGKKNIEILINFIDLENLSSLLINNPDLITLRQKSILLKFIRTFYLMDYLDPINIFKKSFLLTTKQYKSMIKNNIINSNDAILENNNNINHEPQNNNINNELANNHYINHKDLYINKLNYIDKLIKLIDFYIIEIKNFKISNKNESSHNLKVYIEELIFATHEICTKLYYNKNTINKISPYYYKLVLEFIGKKEIFIKILQDIKNQENIDISNYNTLINISKANKEYQHLINRKFNIFDKQVLFKYINKAIFDIFKQTNINEEYCLQKYLETYDVYNEANFPPFSLIEVYDYEYFYQWPENKEEEEKPNSINLNIFSNDNENSIEQLNKVRDAYIDDFKNISKTAFFYILNFESLNKNTDFGAKFVNLFQAFINSTQSYDFENNRTLLCLMTKILFYNGEHIQELFNDMVYDKHFFKNLNRDLNYNIVLCIYLSHKYELCKRCAEITDITKLTIQFLQLLGEGFNTTFHENILKGKIKFREKRKERNEINKYNDKTYEKINEVDNDESSNTRTSIYDENAPIIEQNNEKLENKNEINMIEPNYSIYQTAILNLKRIFYLMELNTLLEGEAGFDKLCILSTNIIDFLIEYIDTIGELTNVIDDNFINLFFGKEKCDKITDISNINKIGIIPIFTMRIKDNHENYDEKSFNKYELRKTMLAYMKIKYFQLLKAYLQVGNKEHFVNLLLAEHLGPIQLYEEILYYMKELINNLVHKDYEKYNHLLNVNKVNSYKDKLTNLYMYEDEFRTSVEISVVFQICIIIAILEENYRITMLKDHFEKDNSIEKNDNIAKIEHNQVNDIYNSDNDKIFKSLNGQIINNNILQSEFNRNNYTQGNINNYIKDEIEGSDVFFIDDTNKNLFAKVNNNKTHLYKTNTYYDNIRQDYQRNKLKEIKKERIKTTLKQKEERHELANTNFESKFSKAVYKFLSSLVSKVEIKISNSENDNEEKKYSINKLTNEISKKIIDFKNEDIVLSNIACVNNLDNNIEFDNNGIIIDKEEKEVEDEFQKKYVFFIKPYLSFHLSTQSKDYFLYNVDRSQANIKYQELLSYSDYFLFEMMYNMKYINKSNILKSLSKVSFYYLQVINYLLILAENALLMYHYYRDYSLSYREYYLESDTDKYKRFIDIVIIIIVKLIIILFAFFIWFYFKFIITYERNVIVQEDKNFIFRRLGQQNEHITHPTIFQYFREEGNLLETISLINEDIGFFNMIKLAVIDSILLNIDINVFVFSFILNILFLILGHPLILSIETLFLYGIFPELLNIFKSFTDKFASLFSCLIFTYLIIYVYNYISIFYIRESFDLGEVFHYDSETFINEPYCYSSLQCFLVLINYGTRSGGGIGDVLPIISYRYDVNYFIGRFIYDMTFFIIIIMIMGNVTFGLIVDTFGALRDDTYKYEDDRKNKCFICQLSRDGCLLRNIDYEKHIKYEHNLWSYVDFLIYLHLYNPNDFNRIEGSVWDKLIERDYGWIPMVEDVGEDDEDD